MLVRQSAESLGPGQAVKAEFRWSRILTPVTGVSTGCTAVTPPCSLHHMAIDSMVNDRYKEYPININIINKLVS